MPKKGFIQGPRNGSAMSFDEIAKSLGITRQRATQIYDTARKKIKRRLAARGYKMEDFTNG